MWSAEDAAEVTTSTGVDAVAPVDLLSRQTFNAMLRPPRPRLFVPFSPAEGEVQSRDEILGHQAGVAADPWDGRPSREAHFLRLLAERYPALERHDLTPILDTLRATKSEREIALIRKASVLAGWDARSHAQHEAGRLRVPGRRRGALHVPRQRREVRGLQPDRRRRHQRVVRPLLAQLDQ